MGGKRTNNVAETINNLIEGSKSLVFKTALSDFFPNLFNRIHLRRIGWNKEQNNVIGNNEGLCFIPGGTIAAEQNRIFLILLGQLTKKYVRAVCIAVWQHKEKVLTSSRLDCSVGIAVFPYMMTGNRRASALFAPAIFGLIDPSESSFVLKHKPNFSTLSTAIVDFFFQFMHFLLNFFEASMTSSLAFFGCRLRGITFRHPLRLST